MRKLKLPWVVERQSWAWTCCVGRQNPGMFYLQIQCVSISWELLKHKFIYLSRLQCTPTWRYGMTCYTILAMLCPQSYQLVFKELNGRATSLHSLPQLPAQERWPFSKGSSLEWEFWEWFARLSSHLLPPSPLSFILYFPPTILKLVFIEDCLSSWLLCREWMLLYYWFGCIIISTQMISFFKMSSHLY